MICPQNGTAVLQGLKYAPYKKNKKRLNELWTPRKFLTEKITQKFEILRGGGGYLRVNQWIVQACDLSTAVGSCTIYSAVVCQAELTALKWDTALTRDSAVLHYQVPGIK